MISQCILYLEFQNLYALSILYLFFGTRHNPPIFKIASLYNIIIYYCWQHIAFFLQITKQCIKGSQ